MANDTDQRFQDLLNSLKSTQASSDDRTSTPSSTQNTTSPNTTSATGAFLRGAANAATLGLDDEALSLASRILGTHDYGSDLRADEQTDATQHPYARAAGEIGGTGASLLIPGAGEANVAGRGLNALRTAYMNPVVNGAISSIGNSNDLNDGNIGGAVANGLEGAAIGGTLGKALDMVGNKFTTGTFAKPPEVVTQLRDGGVATPTQYAMSASDNPVISALGNYIQNATAKSATGVRNNQELLKNINNNFPTMVTRYADHNGLDAPYLEQYLKNNTKFNANDLKNYLDDNINQLLVNSDRGVLSGTPEGLYRGGSDWEDAQDLTNSDLYKFVSQAAPIHRNVEASTQQITPSSSIVGHLLAAAPAIAGVVGGHALGGLGATGALEIAPKVANGIATSIGNNRTVNALSNNASSIPIRSAISQTRSNVGNFIQENGGPVVGNVTSTITDNVNGRKVTAQDKLHALGYSDADIAKLLN